MLGEGEINECEREFPLSLKWINIFWYPLKKPREVKFKLKKKIMGNMQKKYLIKLFFESEIFKCENWVLLFFIFLYLKESIKNGIQKFILQSDYSLR